MAVRRAATVGGIVAAGLVVLLIAAIAVLWVVQRDRTLPNTTVIGIDVSRMTGDEVRATLAPLTEERETEPVVFSFEGQEHVLEPADVAYSIDLDATVESALSRGRTGLPGDIAERVRSMRTSRDYGLDESYDHDLVGAWVAEVADSIDRELSDGSVEVDPDTLEVTVEMPHGSVEVRRDETVDLIVAALLHDGPREHDLPADTAPQRVSDDNVQDVADQVTTAVSRPFELRSGDTSLTLEPRDIALLLEVDEVASGDDVVLQLVVTEDAVEEVMGEVARGRFDVEPVNASFATSRTPPTTFDAQSNATFEPVSADIEVVEGRNGARFDPAVASEQLTELMRDGAREAEVRLEEVEGELSNERAAELAPTHLVGTFTTYYTAGQDRNRNIQRLADVIDGAVVLPGEQFSINEISGERSCDKGYVPAGTIIQGELVDTCGGGTSQFGTTTFNAAFFTGMQLDQWKAHSWYISRYPMGREATLTYPQLDVKFTNTSDGAVLVKTSHTASSITVSIYGQPIAERVSATHGSPTNHRGFNTEVRNTSELRRGQERVVQGGLGGFTVEVVRTVERVDGSTDEQTIRTVYVPQTRIVERGTAS
jgi:vancomycin resistance protein YoaR